MSVQWPHLSLPSSSGLSRDSGIDSGITNGGCFGVLATAVQTADGKESFELIEHDLSEFVAWLLLAVSDAAAALGTWVPAPTSMKTRVSTSSTSWSMLSE